MNDRASDPAGIPAQRLQLGAFVLDLGAGELLAADGELAGLRRQALEVLLVLGRRAGQVVGKDELMHAVWPNVIVGEGSLTQAVADLRRVLGDTEHRTVRLVARRGYMLVPDPVVPARAEPAWLSAAAAGAVALDAPQVAAGAADGSVARTLAAARSATSAPTAAAGSTLAPAPAHGDRRSALLVLLGVVVAIAALAVLAVLAVQGMAWLGRGDAAPGWRSPADLARTPLAKELPPLSIVVLPLAVEGTSADAAWLADALHGDLVIEVARLQGSHVISRDTAATYQGRAVDPRQVARELGVRHLVQGSLRQEGATIRLNLALVDGETGVQRWAETFTAERAELARSVADFAVAIERTLAGALWRSTVESRAALSPDEVGADDLAMQGFALWYRGVTRENVTAARALFDRAVAIDPDSARGWAGVHFTTTNLLFNNWAADLRRAEQAAAHLERVDRDGSYAYSAKAFLLFVKRDFPAMLRHTEEWSTRYRLPLAFGAHGAALILGGRFDDAVPVIERALRLGPRDPFRFEWQTRLAMAHFGAGRYELAREWSQAAANTNPAAVFPPLHAAALHRLGRIDEAQRAFDEHLQRHPGFKARHVLTRLPGSEPAHVEMRERLLFSLRALGLRD